MGLFLTQGAPEAQRHAWNKGASRLQEGGAGALVVIRMLRVALRVWEGLALWGGDWCRQRE